MKKDHLFELAEQYVEETSVSVFLTGKAGTGKTTFLRHIAQHTAKRMVVLAPTGVAAVNAQGSTIHSFFSLPLCPYLPDVPELKTEYQTKEFSRRLRKDKIKIIRTLELLVIDEISMVRADLLDAVDMVLRRYRHSSQPFGGVQLLLIGDAQQLSPVVTEAEKPYIGRVYPSPYFFHSKALQSVPYVTIELQKVYRQDDADFIELLNGIRDARVTPEMLRRLNARVGAPAGDDWIRLTTHNYQADSINEARMAALPGEPFLFDAQVDGDYPESMYPADGKLSLKTGARVMFIRNDSGGLYFNGKLGTVKSMDNQAVIVTDDQGNDIPVERLEWENLQYSLDESSGEITQERKGTFRQLPLRPAWAITIHKSQGLTFDHVIIDAGSAFAFGQVYVALSRCRTLDGISLTRPIYASLLVSDADVSRFNTSFPTPQSVESALPGYRKEYVLACLCECFDFSDLRRMVLTLRKYWKESALASTYPSQMEGLEHIAGDIVESEKIAERFRGQLRRLRDNPSLTEERVAKASAFFLPRVDSLRLDSFLAVEIDNAEVRKRIRNLAADLLPQWQVHRDTLREVSKEGFDVDTFRKLRTMALLEETKPQRKGKSQDSRDVYTDNRHPELVERLIAWRREKAHAENVPAYVILHQKTLLGIADANPGSRAQLLAVPGFGPALWSKYGIEILNLLSGR